MIARANGVGIIGLGVRLPETVGGPDWFRTDLSAREGVLESWRGGSGTKPAATERRFAGPTEASSDLEVGACAAALTSAGLEPSDIDLLVGYSQLPDDVAPANHGRVANRLELPPTASAFTLEAGCASFVTQLNTVSRLIEVGDHRASLTYQSCLVSPVVDPESDGALILGDGAAAQVIGRTDPELGLIGRIQHTRSELCESLVLAPTDGRRRWFEDGSRPFVITTRDREATIKSGALGPDFARETCTALLRRCGLTVTDVDFFVCPQPTHWYADACAEEMGIRQGRWITSEDHFHKYGHLLAASVSLNLYLAWQHRLLRQGDLVLVFSPGVGFTLAASILRWAMPPPPTAPRALPPGTAPAG